MISSKGSYLAVEALSHPLVLRAAWMRIAEWYRRGNIAPEPELSVWQLDPERQLQSLQVSIRSGDWQPSEWLQLPYPKKGKRLRHFVWPTVRDQVAFMAHMVLLAPIIENRLNNFVFGNRWYRPVLWDRRKKKWQSLPYPLLTRRTYLPYARDHGLYRRVASWTISHMTGTPIERTDRKGQKRPKDYQKKFLPDWAHSTWWLPNTEGCNRAYWAALDLELAYPSVRLNYLRHCLHDVLNRAVKAELLSGYPACALDAISDDGTRLALADRLGSALIAVQIRHGGIPRPSWRPTHARPELFPDKDLGIPTGLAISGILLNVVLHPSDRSIWRHIKRTRGPDRGAVLRFADDMYVFSRSPDGVLSLMEVVAKEVARPSDVPWLPKQSSDGSGRDFGLLSARTEAEKDAESNFYVNLEKVRPDCVKQVIDKARESMGWEKCEVCGVWHLRGASRRTEPVDGWWRRVRDRPEHALLREEWERSSVAAGSVGPFLTVLVERMSEIGWGGLGERFGGGAWDRLDRLEELARFDIDDEQVRPDTRRVFAANRLVNAWIPAEGGNAHVGRERIQDAVEKVLQSTPWKFALWTAVVKAAVRTSDDEVELKTRGKRRKERDGGEWLERQLRQIAHSTKTAESWATRWPESLQDKHDRGSGWKDLYLSFHRASFWQGTRTVLHALWAHQEQVEDAVCEEASRLGPSPNSWCYRAIPEGRHREAIELLGDVDRWIRVLYGGSDDYAALVERRWELDQIVAVVLATAPRSEAVAAWSRCDSPVELLSVPSDFPHLGAEAAKLLQATGRLRPGVEGARPLDRRALEHLALSGRGRRTGETLYPDGRPYVRGWESDRAGLVKAGQTLGCGPNIDARMMGLRWDAPATVVEKVIQDPLCLENYAAVRRSLLGGEFLRSEANCTLHRLLWSVPRNSDLSTWRLRPWDMPSVGLPLRVAVLLFLNGSDPPTDWMPAAGPFTWAFAEGQRLLVEGRRIQFDSHAAIESNDVGKITDDSSKGGVSVRRSQGWEVPPHGAYFLPFVHGRAEELHPEGYTLFCDVLLFLTALDGGERILDELVRTSTGSWPFHERWGWRSRIHLRAETWRAIEQIIRWSSDPSAASKRAGEDLSETLRETLRKSMLDANEITSEDFTIERVDLHVDSGEGLEISRTVHRRDQPVGPLPPELYLDRNLRTRNLDVRLAQVIVDIDKEAVGSLHLSSSARNRVMEQVFGAFQVPSYGRTDRERLSPDLAVFPELTIPEEEIRSVRDCIENTGLAALTGLYWRALPPVYPASGGTIPKNRWIVNEAELGVPVGYDDRGPTSVRWYRVRKPIPAHNETGRCSALKKKLLGNWQMVPGRKLYRLIHSRWGDFSVAICSDLIDAAPWRTLRGEILHLFVVAYNRDVRLYDALTWARAYENYANLVAVNSGRYGGSIAWTPKRSPYGREVARLGGGDMSVVADIRLPVRDLLREQSRGARDAVRRAAKEWEGHGPGKVEFKSPPPGFRRRAVSENTGSTRTARKG